MNKRSLARTEKISRHRRFLEDRAKADLQLQSRQTRQAHVQFERSQSGLEATTRWKGSAWPNGCLDLTSYAQALHLESIGVLAVATAASALDAAKNQEKTAVDGHLAARNGTRVASARLERACGQWHLQQERLHFDQMSDLWLANKDKRA